MNQRTSPEVAALLNQGIAHERAGRVIDARAAFRKALDLDARSVPALTQLALLDQRAQNFFGAASHFEHALAIEPKSRDALNNLAMVHLHLGRPDKALPLALTSQKLDRKSLETLKILFKCALNLGRPDDARGFLAEALKLKPSDPAFTLDLAQTWDMSGEPEKAAALYRGLIRAGHKSPFAYEGLARSEKYREEPPEYAEIKAALANTAVPLRFQRWLYGALGKIDDDLGRYDSAFASFAAARSPDRARDYVKRFAAYVARAKQIFTRDFFTERAAVGDTSVRPVFVVGMPRSGTTLVDQILSSHPDVASANELTFFLVESERAFGKDRTSDAFAAAVRAWPQQAARSVAKDYLELLAAHSPTVTHVVDKMPGNFERLWLLALLFPNARFIHCLRDPMATCVSCFIQPMAEINAFTDDLASLGAYHRLYQELMAHWRAVLPVEMLEVEYETLVRNPEAETRRLVAHVGVEWNDACLRFYQTKRAVMTPSRRQVEEPMHTRAIDAWRRYEKHLAPLLAALRD